MSGDAIFAGTNYQASVIAYVFVHVLTETKLRWIGVADDTPSAVSGEVKGPGDDARVEFRTGASPVEIQAKHGLKPQKCIEAFEAIRDASTAGDATGVLLVVDSTSSTAVRNDLWRDLDRLRSGRRDGLKELTQNVISALGSRAEDDYRPASYPGGLGGDGAEFSTARHCQGCGACRERGTRTPPERTATR